MPVVVVGLSHRTAPLDVLEAMTVGRGDSRITAHAIRSSQHVSEVVVLSTCNRMEIYALAEEFHPAYADVRRILSQLSRLEPDDFSDYLYEYHGAAAAAHLFDVVSGLQSAVLGEHEIQGQVRSAWELAQADGAAGPMLNLLFRHAIEAGKRARSETRIGRGAASVPYAAVSLARERLGDLDGRRAVAVGAGHMGSSIARILASVGVTDLVIANRTFRIAAELASAVGGRAADLANLSAELSSADVLFTTASSSSIMLTQADVEKALEARDGRPLVVVDVAVPRNVDPAIAGLSGVTLFDMNDVGAFADQAVAGRRREVQAVRDLLDEEVDRYRAAVSGREVAALIVALRAEAETARVAALDGMHSRLAELDRHQLAVVETVTQALISKLLHHPTVALRAAAGTAKGECLAQALRELFAIDKSH